MARLEFVLWALQARFRAKHQGCPYCGSSLHALVQRKKLLIEARKCHYCGLIFRWPADSPDRAMAYYQESYRSAIATDLPTEPELADLLAGRPDRTRFDSAARVRLVREVAPPPARLLDFGASWGYTAIQLQQAGYRVEGFELSRSRAEYGSRSLGLPIHYDWAAFVAQRERRFDLIYTSHTLEHTYDLRSVLEGFARLLADGGRLLIIVPNASGRAARRLGVRWGPYIGESHTIAFTADWLRANLPRHGFGEISCFSSGAAGNDPLCDGDDLICVARLQPGRHRASRSPSLSDTQYV